MKLVERPAYSYREDPTVPDFPDDHPVLFVDGACGLCSRGAQLIARRDPAGLFRFATVQSPLGRAILRHYGLDPDDTRSWLLVEQGRATASLAAVTSVGGRLNGVWPFLARVLMLLPESVQDWIYTVTARNRYRIFGRDELCSVGDTDLRKRILD